MGKKSFENFKILTRYEELKLKLKRSKRKIMRTCRFEEDFVGTLSKCKALGESAWVSVQAQSKSTFLESIKQAGHWNRKPAKNHIHMNIWDNP